jgi:hypothetical protein
MSRRPEMLDEKLGLVQINSDTRLFVLACGKGYTCLGFDVCERWTHDYAETLARPDLAPVEVGTVEAYRAYQRASDALRLSSKKCLTDLTAQLIGLEGKRVEVVDASGETRRFYVGKSTGWAPVHLEIATGEVRCTVRPSKVCA